MPSSQASSSRSAAFRSTMPPSPQNPPTSKNGKLAPTCAEKESLPRRRGLQEFDVRTSRKGSLPPHPPGLATMRMAARPSSVLQRNARRTRPYCSARPAGAVQVGNITARVAGASIRAKSKCEPTRRRVGASPVVSTSAPPRGLDGGDVDLLHRHHRLEGTLCLTATGGKRIGQRARGDLPGEAP